MRTAIGKAAIIILSLFLLFYVGYQAWKFFYDPYKTEVAVRYSVSETMRVNGIAVRTEELIFASDAGSVSYTREDASKVLKNTCIAYTHSSLDTVDNARKAEELEREISLLREADATAEQGYGTSDLLNQQVGDALIDMAGASDADTLGDVAACREHLMLLLNKRQILIGAETGYEVRIAELENQRALLLNKVSGDSEKAVTAPSSGYFISVVDGFEEKVNKESVLEMTVADIEGLINSEVEYSGQAVGKIADDYYWYYVITVEPEEAGIFYEGMNVNAVFDGTGSYETEMEVISIISDETSENVAVVMSCESITPELSVLRQTGAELVFARFSGIRVSDEAIRYNDAQERGVYVLDRGTVKFKLVDIIYEGVGYKLCRWQQGVTDTLQLFDEIFVRGSDLYDGKAVE